MLNTKSKMFKVKYSVLVFMCALLGMNAMAQETPKFENEQYQKALWMTTRFYGAQRMGEGVNWLVATHEANDVANNIGFDRSKFVKGKSFLKDADGDYDLKGGWFDCGDMVLFGQTFYYSVYMLLLGYAEFPNGYPDFYSEDYHGYINADDYTWEGGKGEPDGIPDILNEVKYATDFILKAVRDNRTFYYQKGDGNADHKIWCTSPVKSALPKSNGGEADGPRSILKATGNATAMASQASSALAIMSRVYAKYDQAYADACLEKAKVACEFVEQTSKGTTSAAFYGAGNRYVHDMVSMYAELYKATQDPTYLKKAEENCSWMNESTDPKKNAEYKYNYTLCWDHREDLAAYEMASLSDVSEWGEQAKKVMSYYVDEMYKPKSGYLLNVQGNQWGALRYPANQAFVYALYDKLTGAEGINPYTLYNVEYIMGKNSKNQSYIVGFGDKCPYFPHHRNFFRTDINDLDREKNKLPKVDNNYKYIQFGYLVGGSLKDGYYEDNSSSYSMTEGGIDYNAGLVGALGYLNAKMNPVNTTDAENISLSERCLIYPNPAKEQLSILLNGNDSQTATVEIIDQLGNLRFTQSMNGNNRSLNISGLGQGIYLIRVISGNEAHTQRFVKE